MSAGSPGWAPRGPGKRVAWGLLALFMIAMGVLHFVITNFFVLAMPPYLPWHRELVYVSGVCELAGGVGLLIPRLRRVAAWGLVALLVAVFPANIHMAVNQVQFTPEPIAPWIWWARLPLQVPLIALAWWMTRDEPRR
ncbi:MAG: DoxX family protein [Nannocystis sp.]|nr:DoxX family protein [Nannocystis sp.]